MTREEVVSAASPRACPGAPGNSTPLAHHRPHLGKRSAGCPAKPVAAGERRAQSQETQGGTTPPSHPLLRLTRLACPSNRRPLPTLPPLATTPARGADRRSIVRSRGRGRSIIRCARWSVIRCRHRQRRTCRRRKIDRRRWYSIARCHARHHRRTRIIDRHGRHIVGHRGTQPNGCDRRRVIGHGTATRRCTNGPRTDDRRRATTRRLNGRRGGVGRDCGIRRP